MEGATSQAKFNPREDLINRLIDVGISRNASVRGLFYTGNNNADLAAAWIFENEDKNLDLPIQDGELNLNDFSDEDEGEVLMAAASLEAYKMVFVINSALNMGVGKIAAQVGHATVGLYRILIDNHAKYGQAVLKWEEYGETKIVVKGDNAVHLNELSSKAQLLQLPTYVVHDAGRTQIEPGSLTVLGIMGKTEAVDEVTGKLKLL